jgi:ABC-type transporter Mla subunit MlaD
MSPTSDQNSPPPMPRWVRVFAILAAILILLVAVALIWFPGRHGPGRHIHGSDAHGNHSATAQGAGPDT